MKEPMTDHEREQIAYYLPHEADPGLDSGEYYYLQYTAGKERVIHVYALDILPLHDGTEYGIYQQRGGRLQWIDAGWGDSTRGVRMGDLYDNKEDCRAQTHGGVSWWPELREKQKAEGNRQ